MQSVSYVDKFNEIVSQFILDLKKICPENKDLFKIEQLITIICTHSRKKAIIAKFQANVLRDDFVKNILLKNTDYFINYKFVNDVDSNVSIINRTQNIVKNLHEKKDINSIECVFNWVTLMVYFAYKDLGIDADEMFTKLVHS